MHVIHEFSFRETFRQRKIKRKKWQMLSFPSAPECNLVQNMYHCSEWCINQLLGSFYCTITHLCQELSPHNSFKFPLGFIVTNSSQGKWFTACAEAAPEEEIFVTTGPWWAWHADFVTCPVSTKDLLSWAQFASVVAAALQMFFGSLGIVMLLWEPLMSTECAFTHPDLGFLAL